jgi:hypothetical protein
VEPRVRLGFKKAEFLGAAEAVPLSLSGCPSRSGELNAGLWRWACGVCRLQFSDRWLRGQKQQTVNLPAHVAYGGSNPPLSTRVWDRKTSSEAQNLDFGCTTFEIAGVTQW